MSRKRESDGHLLAAWSELDGDGAGHIYVKRYDQVLQSWSLLGGGEASTGASASAPSLAVIGGVVWVAYLEDAAGVQQVIVRRLAQGGSWQPIGTVLNADAGDDAHAPVVADVTDRPCVAFREGPSGGAQALWLKCY